MKFIVTAGGQGKKLWPYSRKKLPKQFQPLIEGKSLFQINIEVLLKICSPEDIFISTKKQYAELVKFQAPQLLAENLILEPNIAKDRGPGEGLAFVVMSIRFPDEPFMLVQSDVLRTPDNGFVNMISEMETLVRKEKKYITGGIKVEKPIMGNDYLVLGDKVEVATGIEIYKVSKFLGRSSDYNESLKMLKTSGAALHSNHSCWYPKMMLEAYQKHRPDWYEALMEIKSAIEENKDYSEIEMIFSEMEKGSTEEVTKNIMSEGYVVLLPFKWNDIGTWGSYYELFAKGEEVYGDGKVVSFGSERSLVKASNPKKLVVLHNIKDLIVIDSDDALLIMPREDEGKVSKIVEELEKEGLEEFV